MKKTRIFGAITLMIFLTACSLIQTPTSAPTQVIEPTQTVPTAIPTAIPPTQAPGLTVEGLMNSVYYAPQLQKSVQLTDGKYSETNGAVEYTVLLQPQIGFGDLNMDGIEDAAVLLAETSGGTGVFYSLVALVSNLGGYSQTNDQYIDDRAIIHSLQIVNEEVILNATVHGFSDSMVEPTLNTTKSFRLFGGKLTLWRFTTLMDTGIDRSINIDSPGEGTEVSGEVRLIGNMPIGPFENNLAFRVLDETGNILYESGFMVNAPDMGAPATFDNVVSLPSLPSGTNIQVQLLELSMRDGSPMTIDSVGLKTK
jgi:hypothetical protein